MQFPYVEVELESTGAIHDDGQRRAALELAARPGTTDLLVLCHGWNNDIPQARRLYARLTDHLAAVRPAVPAAATRSLAVIGVLWPSIRWTDDDPVAGGGAGFGDGTGFGAEAAALAEEIGTRIEDPGRAARLIRLVPRLADSSEARREFLDTLREQLPPPPAAPDPGIMTVDEDPPPAALRHGEPDRVFAEAGGPEFDPGLPERPGGAAVSDLGGPAPSSSARPGVGRPAEPDLGGATAGFTPGAVAASDLGGAVGLDLDGAVRRARDLLNVTSYYTMKDRAGKVGAGGVATLLAGLAGVAPGARLHLAGHSFGARALAAAGAKHLAVHSVTLLQAAFSHHGFAVDFDGRGHHGLFRPLLTSGRMTGPLVITHTVNDRAVGLAYALASRLARQAGAGVGDANDPYGGLGRNGALKTPEVFQPAGDLQEVGGGYAFRPGRVHNLRADTFIRSHSDVSSPQVGYALLNALCTV
ncbi:hypothetical protein [Plantactinospora sonchi]|uniref:Serine-threonine protein kinase n=1 Tax=Plantactinospora sonchi TaxID=1544735 RepID=A0ABU7S1P7_9ACTN